MQEAAKAVDGRVQGQVKMNAVQKQLGTLLARHDGLGCTATVVRLPRDLDLALQLLGKSSQRTRANGAAMAGGRTAVCCPTEFVVGCAVDTAAELVLPTELQLQQHVIRNHVEDFDKLGTDHHYKCASSLDFDTCWSFVVRFFFVPA